jgi:hypothetical protein
MANRRSLALRRNDASNPLRPGVPPNLPAYLDPAVGTATVPYTAGTGVATVADPPGAATYWRVVGGVAEVGRNGAGTLYPGQIRSLEVTQSAPPFTNVLSEPFDNLTAWALTGTPTVVAGRTGTAVQITNNATTAASYNIAAPAQSDYITVGFAFRITDPSGAALQRDIIKFNSDAGATNHNKLSYQGPTLGFFRGGTLLGTATYTFTQNVWYYIEIQARLHDTAGSAVVRINGTPVITVPTADTKNAGTKTVYDQIQLMVSQASSLTNQWDDLYLLTGSGAPLRGDPYLILTPGFVFSEPFDSLSAWTASGAPSLVAGRTGTAAQLVSSADVLDYNIPAGGQSDELIIGFAWRHNDAATWVREIFGLYSSAGALQRNRIYYELATTTLTVTRGANPIATNTTLTLAANTWYYIELRIKLHPTAGFVIVKVNGTEVINATGLNTGTGVPMVYDLVRLLNGNIATHGLWDDLYLKTGAGATFGADPIIPPATVAPPDAGFRFDANERIGSATTYIDPRGETWTLSSALAIVPPAPAYAAPNEWDSALRSDFSYIPEDLDPPKAILHVRDISHTSIEAAFDPLQMPIDPNFGAPTEIALVRSPSGYPATLLDGTMVRRHPPTAPDNAGWVRIPDTGLTPGTWYYYGLFIKYFSAGNTYWLRVSTASVLLPQEYLSADHLWERIPEWYRRADMEPGDQLGVLRRLIDTVGYETDAHRTWAHTIGDVWDAEKISADLLPFLGDTLGQPVEYAAGDERYRALLSNILPLRKIKGTEIGTEAYLSSITGYRTRVYSGLNLLPTIDESEGKYSSGLWQKGTAGNATLTRVVSDGSATPGPANGHTYHRMTYNTAVSQQPAMQLGTSADLTRMVPVIAGHQYRTSAFFRSSFTGTYNVRYRWLTAAGGVVSTTTTALGAIATGWIRRTAPLTTAPAGAAFAEINLELSAATAVAGLVVEVTDILVCDLAWRPEDVPGAVNTPPLSGANPGFYDDVNYYEAPRTVYVNVYPQRINYALNSLFMMDNIPAGAWTVAERPTWGLLKQAYDSWGDIHDAQPGDSEADWADLAEGFAPLAGDWTITFETINQRMRLNPAGAPNYNAQVQSGFVPVVPGDSISAAFVSWATVADVQLTLSVQFYTDDAPEDVLVIDGSRQNVHGAPHALLTSPYRYELRNAVVPEGAAFARVVIETSHTATYNVYLQQALIENAQVPGSYFNGDEVDSAFGDYFFIGLPHESYSVYYQNYRSFINDAGGSDRITSLMDELLPMESDFVLRTAAFGLY